MSLTPNLNEEKKLWRKGYKYVVGLDEAGRGPLAGPVVAGAVVLSSKFKVKSSKLLKEVNDSKKLSPKKREELYKLLTNHSDIGWGVGIVSEKVIDKINILEATKLAMLKAVKNLDKKLRLKKYQLFHDRGKVGIIEFLILDGNFALPAEAFLPADLSAEARRAKAEARRAKVEAKTGISSPISQKSIIKADEKVFSCAAASIIAKVHRDRLMEKQHKKYPLYGFDKHKGYPTKSHQKMLEKYGPCRIHRKSFRPVADFKFCG